MSNERNTENLVRDKLRKLGYYDNECSTRVEEQKSETEAIKRLLKSASKTGKGGKGAPEFIISDSSTSDFLVVFECKADIKHHESSNRDDAVGFAVDGALHYAAHLAKEFNVIAVAASGQTKSQLKISTFLHPKGAAQAKELHTKSGKSINTIIPWSDYIEHGTFDPTIQALRHDELMAFSRELHDFMRDHAKLTESEKPLLVSGTLIALQNWAFVKSFDTYKPEDLQKQWFRVIKEEIEKADLPQAKKYNMTQPYSAIAVAPALGKPSDAKTAAKYPKGVLHELIKDLNEKVWPFISIYHDFDVVGQFYGEFLKYTGGDKKALGIVLTPRHVTDLFARLANVNKNSTVLDICAGTGGFLVSAMFHMIRHAVTKEEKDRIKRDGLIGVEHLPNMYALAASNMILRGDGKANLHQGSCFDPAIVKSLKEEHHCNVGLLNPPYSQSDEALHELVFVKQMLDCLEPNSVGIAIVPISCAISPHPMREELMRSHTLEAVMSMPTELFYPVGTVTCIMVWTAHKPHAESDKKTWFGYWKDDGFIKTKHRGRIDQYHRWEAIRDRWVEMFRNREVHAGESVLQKVTHTDEWCAEAYMETDYSYLGRPLYERTVKQFLLSRLLNEAIYDITDNESSDTEGE
ncbi:class I SAM-dependent DNA methyltransferase [Methyloglobulus sp.]|uniref:HsdM family class I SAM-dependent methyltransferase n=1 Tax=Methyloglobulus sp. TaxID=2518622 RepID=UPI003989A0EF